MRLSDELLPLGSSLIRVHYTDSVDYAGVFVIKKLSKDTCEISGFAGVKVTKYLLILAFKKCRELGFNYCIIKRVKELKYTLNTYNLEKY